MKPLAWVFLLEVPGGPDEINRLRLAEVRRWSLCEIGRVGELKRHLQRGR